ncbi:MAG: methyltransferase domain-containing protein [Chitinophagia bacterium]|nr:methyltransferase domain-containing protein [Chitinophagia bacterium]
MGYLLDSLLRYGSDQSCPYCGSRSSRPLERKYLVTRLFRCRECDLQYRHPKANAADSLDFYQDDYVQEDGITTELPDATRLRFLVDTGFGEKNVDHYATLFGRMFPDLARGEVRIIDYGCSWGYQGHQFRKHGFQYAGLEVSRRRAAFGREQLGLDIVTSEAELRGGADVFFSSHVIEHLPDPGRMITMGMDLLRPGGYFVAECPNGSEVRRRREPRLTRKAWGMVHPNLISGEFLAGAMADKTFLLTSTPFHDLTAVFDAWGGIGSEVGDLTGSNLLIIAKKS